jgi:hypothetical protein
MTSKNTLTEQSNNHLENEDFNCRTRSAGDTGLMECLMKTIGCPWVSSLGDTRYCKHPSVKQFVDSNQF